MPDPTTLLVITGMNVPPYSARGLTQSLEPISAAQQTRRTINGTLLDVSSAQFRKYASTITCSDQQVPSINGIWPGAQVTVECVAELCYKTTGGSADRTPVSGSSRTEGEFTFYRPQLFMRVLSYSEDVDEWNAVTSWSLQLEEI